MELRLRRKWRRPIRAVVYGGILVALGVAAMADALRRRSLVPSDEPVPLRLKGLPWDQQVYWMEFVLSIAMILVGVLTGTVILSRTRRR